MVHCIGILTSMFSAVFFSRGIVNLWYGGKKKLKTLAIGQVWRPQPEGIDAAAAYLANEDAATDTARAVAAASAKPKGKAAAQARAKPTVRRRDASNASNPPQKPGSSR
jgi:preprotein translocase subunit SecD